MNEPKNNFLGGPIDGRLFPVNPQLSVWFHPIEAQIASFDETSFEDRLKPVERTAYHRVTGRTFMHESEAF